MLESQARVLRVPTSPQEDDLSARLTYAALMDPRQPRLLATTPAKPVWRLSFSTYEVIFNFLTLFARNTPGRRFDIDLSFTRLLFQGLCCTLARQDLVI